MTLHKIVAQLPQCLLDKQQGQIDCAMAIEQKILPLIGTNKIVAKNDTEKVNGHYSIFHGSDGLHTIWIFLYDNDNIHESESVNVIVKKLKQSRIKKYIGAKPTTSQFETVIKQLQVVN